MSLERIYRAGNSVGKSCFPYDTSQELVYLASPYSSPDAAVRHQRFVAACRAAGQLMQKGSVVFCPIAHSHPISEALCGRHMDHDFWMSQDLPILAHCSRMLVLRLEGWQKSNGIAQEIRFANERGIPIEFISENTEGLNG